MTDWDDGSRDKRPFPDGDDEDLFVWGELRPPRREPERPSGREPRPRTWYDEDDTGGFEVPTGRPRPADSAASWLK